MPDTDFPPTATIYPSEITIDHFDQDRLDTYWRFVAERMRVYARRIEGQPWPWTADAVMQNEFITNMYRELDPGTTYVIDEIIDRQGWSAEDKIFNVMMYRLMGSVPETHMQIACAIEEYVVEDFVAILRQSSAEQQKVFGDAYRVAGYHDYKGDDKIENVARLFARVVERMPEIWRRVQGAAELKDVFQVFKDVPGMGEFLAHQVTVDLLYATDTADPIVPFGPNDFAVAGPGARAGIWTLLKPHVKPRNLGIVMQFLYENQAMGFAVVYDYHNLIITPPPEVPGQDFQVLPREIHVPYIADEDGNPVPLSLCNIQSTLCEWYKYYRLWCGEKKGAVRKYDPSKTTDIPTTPRTVLTTEEIAALQGAPSLTPVYVVPAYDPAEEEGQADDEGPQYSDGSVDYVPSIGVAKHSAEAGQSLEVALSDYGIGKVLEQMHLDQLIKVEINVHLHPPG